MNKKTQLLLASLATTMLVVGCASGPSFVELNALTDKIVKASFRDQSHVKVERITATDETNRLAHRRSQPQSHQVAL
jgi:sulfur-oxidizing protein SoxX